MQIDLTKSQCDNLATFIDIWLLKDIREDTDIDNLDYLRDMLDAQKKFEEATEGSEDSFSSNYEALKNMDFEDLADVFYRTSIGEAVELASWEKWLKGKPMYD